METWELVARERIRDTLARYNWSGDAFRLDELAQAFCEDGVMEVRGQEPLHYAVDGGPFPTGTGANPTLTIMANAWRVAERIAEAQGWS